MVSVEPLALAGLVLGLASIAHLVLAIRSVHRFNGFRLDEPSEAPPPITILKPLCGAETDLESCLRSFCEQDYPCFQIVFGVSDPGDPAIPVVERLRAAFPTLDTALVIDRTPRGANPKVSNLINMMAAAKHPLLVISDSDVKAGPGCLSAIVAPLEDPRVGAVTCLYRGAPTAGLASRLGALFINDWYLPSVLVDAGMREIDFCFGPVTLVRRHALDAIGGFTRLAPHLADDYLLGKLITGTGYKVVLSGYAVSTVVNEPDLGSMLARELRWARTVRTCQGIDQWLTLVTQPLPLTALLLLLPRPTLLGAVVVATAVGLRLVLSQLVRERFALERPAPLWMVPIRECLCFGVWAASLVGRSVDWRGRRFDVTAEGRLQERTSGAGAEPALAFSEAYSDAQSPSA